MRVSNLIIGDLSGSLGALTFYKANGNQYARFRGQPKPITTNQSLGVQSATNYAAYFWSVLDESAKTTWRGAASSFGFRSGWLLYRAAFLNCYLGIGCNWSSLTGITNSFADFNAFDTIMNLMLFDTPDYQPQGDFNILNLTYTCNLVKTGFNPPYSYSANIYIRDPASIAFNKVQNAYGEYIGIIFEINCKFRNRQKAKRLIYIPICKFGTSAATQQIEISGLEALLGYSAGELDLLIGYDLKLRLITTQHLYSSLEVYNVSGTL